MSTMNKKFKKGLRKQIVGVICMFSFLLIGCAHVLAPPSSNLFEGSKANIKYEIPPEAAIINARYFMGPYQGGDRLQFEIELKNISDKEHRYKLRIMLDEGDAIGGLFPRKVKKGTIGIAPGKTVKRLLPMYYGQESKGFLIKVEVF